jgi:hypothetical protein
VTTLEPYQGEPTMIRTVWLAFTCLIGLAALTVVKVGTKAFFDQSVLSSQETIGTNLQSDVSAKEDRLDQIYPDDAPKPVKSITIVSKIAEPTPPRTTDNTPEKNWHGSYAKRIISGHRKVRLHKAPKHHRSHDVSQSHLASKQMSNPKSRRLTKQKGS